MDIAEKMAADIALDMGGGEWKDGKWYSKFHRDAWIKAVKPYADEIERLRKDYALAWENHLLHEQIFVLTEAKIESLRDALRWAAPYVQDDLRVSAIIKAALKEGSDVS